MTTKQGMQKKQQDTKYEIKIFKPRKFVLVRKFAGFESGSIFTQAGPGYEVEAYYYTDSSEFPIHGDFLEAMPEVFMEL